MVHFPNVCTSHGEKVHTVVVPGGGGSTKSGVLNMMVNASLLHMNSLICCLILASMHYCFGKSIHRTNF